MRFKEIIKKILEYLSNLSVFGFSKINKQKNVFHKIFWIFFVLIGTFISIYLSIQVISDYLSFDKITKFESIYEQPTQFPTLSFCSDLPYEFDNKSLKKEVINYCSDLYKERFGICYRFKISMVV